MIAGFAGSFYFLTLVLKTLPMGITYALASALGIIVVALAGILFFGQTLDLAAVIGLGFIVTGMVIINAFSNMALH